MSRPVAASELARAGHASSRLSFPALRTRLNYADVNPKVSRIPPSPSKYLTSTSRPPCCW
jgi:hypothetical protein